MPPPSGMAVPAADLLSACFSEELFCSLSLLRPFAAVSLLSGLETGLASAGLASSGFDGGLLPSFPAVSPRLLSCDGFLLLTSGRSELFLSRAGCSCLAAAGFCCAAWEGFLSCSGLLCSLAAGLSRADDGSGLPVRPCPSEIGRASCRGG